MNRLSDAVANLSDSSRLRWLALLCLAWLLPGLIGHQPWKPDDAHSFGLVQHILKSGEWGVPTLAGEPFMDKPPLYYGVAAQFANFFSPFLPVHDAARLTSGFFMALALLFTGLAGRTLWGKGQGRIAVLLLLGCMGLLIRAHELVAETAQLAGFALALYGLAIGRQHPLAAGLALGCGTGMAFMSGGLLVPAILLAGVPMLLAFPAWRGRAFAFSLLVAIAALLPWLLVWPIWLHFHAPELLDSWWQAQLAVLFNPGGTAFGFYFRNLPWFAWPALPIALWMLWREKPVRPETCALALISLVTLLLLGFGAQARELHALPLLLPLSLLATPGVDQLRRGAANALNWFGIMTFGFFSGLLWFFWFALMTGHPERNARHLLKMQPGYTPEFVPLAFVVALFYTMAWLTVLAATRRLPHGRRAIVNWGVGITLLWGIATTISLPWIDAGKSYRSTFTGLQQALPSAYGCVAGVGLGNAQRAMLDYYAGVVTRRAADAAQAGCGLLLVQGQAGTPYAAPDSWRLRWQGARPGEKSERFWLFEEVRSAP
jgi:4-amino-4-deoxy-L-arabinose transferase-like glycosyltransferase